MNRLRTRDSLSCALLASVVAIAAAAARAADVEFSSVEIQRILRHSPLPSPPDDETNEFADDPRAVRLGHGLFFDPRLSSGGRVSCSSCHDPQRGFSDGKPLAEGIGTGTRSTPTLWNVAYNRWFFWDGRADSLWAQVIQPIEHPAEMGFTRVELARLIARDDALRAAYESIFGGLPGRFDGPRFPPAARPVAGEAEHPHDAAWRAMAEADRDAVNRVAANVGKALAAYQRKLVSRDSPFDRFAAALRAADKAGMAKYPENAKRGLMLFIGRGNCRFCHVGPNFTDGEFHSTRVAPREGGPARDPGRYAGVELVKRDPFNALGRYSAKTDGRGAEKIETLVNKPDNWGLFKTPTLRNVATTAPYMHQGQFATLRDVVRFYSTFEGALPPDHHARETILRPLHLTEDEMDDLIAFLESLTGADIDPVWTKPPPSRRADASD